MDLTRAPDTLEITYKTTSVDRAERILVNGKPMTDNYGLALEDMMRFFIVDSRRGSEVVGHNGRIYERVDMKSHNKDLVTFTYIEINNQNQSNP